MLEETRNFHNGFDDPRPSSCQAQPGSTKQTPGTTVATLASKDSGVNAALVELGCVRSSWYHTSMTCQALC